VRVANQTYTHNTMSRHLMTPIQQGPQNDRARSRPRVVRPDRTHSGPFASSAVRFGRVEHRDGAGHLAPSYEAELRATVESRGRNSEPLAFLRGMSSADTDAEETGEEFVLTVTSGENGGRAADDQDDGERGAGPFAGINARAQFENDTEESDSPNPRRKTFPIR